MGPETGPSSRAQSYPWLLVLLGILGFAWFRSRAQAPFSKSTESVDAHNRNDYGTDDSSHDSRQRIGVAETNSPPTPTQCRYPAKKPKRWYKRWKPYVFLLNVATFIAVVWYACTTRNMWKEMRTQTETGQKQLEQSERAWLILDITADSGFEFTKEGEARITFIPHINNIGKSVATGVTFNAKLFLQDPVNGDRFFREPLQHQKELCDTIAKTPLATGNDTSMALTIFPTDTNQELGHGFSIWKGKNLTIP